MLSARQIKFCELYAFSGEGAKSYVGAGYSETKGAKQSAYDLLKKPEISAYIDQLREEHLQNSDINAERLIRELKGIAFANITDFVQINSLGIDVKDVDDLPDWKTAAIAEVSEQRNDFGGSSVKLKLHPKLDAVKTLLKIIGADVPKVDTEPPLGNTLESGEFKLKRRSSNPTDAAGDASPNTPAL